MKYTQWFDIQASKHKTILKKLMTMNYTKEQIIDYFDFDSMVKNENNFCILYKTNKKCHDINNLNCYFCACPNFRFNDNGFTKEKNKTQHSFCAVNSKEGNQVIYGKAIHQDCSKCLVPHRKEYTKKYFDLDWKKVMLECKCT